jgi:hypothetical protein
MKAQRTGSLLGLAGLAILLTIFILTLGAAGTADPARADRGSTEALTALARVPAGSAGAFEPAASGAYTVSLPLIQGTTGNYALQFDGVDDFVSIADTGRFDFDQSFSVEVWIRILPSEPTNQARGIVTGDTSEPPAWLSKWSVELSHFDNSRWDFWVCTANCQGVASGPDPLQEGVWQHLAGTYDGSQITIYEDGEKVWSLPQSGDVADVDFVFLGRSEASFHGVLDEVRLWDVVRSEADIQADMHRSLSGNEAGLVGYWRLDEGEGQVAFDATDGHSDGRLGSTPASDSSDPEWVDFGAPLR